MADPTSPPPPNPPTPPPQPHAPTDFPTAPLVDTASTLSPLPPSPAALAPEPEAQPEPESPEAPAPPAEANQEAKQPAPEAAFEHVVAPGGGEGEDVEMANEGGEEGPEVKPLEGPAQGEGADQAEDVPFGGEVSPEHNALALPTTDQSLLNPAMEEDVPPPIIPQPDQPASPAQPSDPSPLPPADPTPDPPSAPSPAPPPQPEIKVEPSPAPPAPEPATLETVPTPTPVPAPAPDVVIVDSAPQPLAAPAPPTDPYSDPTSAAAQAALAASQWNGLLHWTRKSRGPQWDWATGRYHVPLHSPQYYSGVTEMDTSDPVKASALPTYLLSHHSLPGAVAGTATPLAAAGGSVPATPHGEASFHDSGRPRRSRR